MLMLKQEIKYRSSAHKDSAHRDCNINAKLNHNIPVEFDNLEDCSLHLVMPNSILK